MSLEGKLARWREAGLIDAATAARIEAFEHAGRRPVVLYALGALGAGTVALGIISIIAANWDGISGSVKLACDLAFGAALAAATAYSVLHKRALLTEVMVTLFYGFTLASLALVGQVYQLGTPTYQALLVWSAATFPLLLLGHSRYLAALGVWGLATTHGYSLEALMDYIGREGRWGDDVERNLLASLMFASALLYALLGRVPWLLRERPEYARTLTALGWSAVLGSGLALQFVWYEDIHSGQTLTWALPATALMAAVFVMLLLRSTPTLPQAARRGIAALLGFAWLTLAFGLGFARDDVTFVGAILQVVWLGLFAWTAVQLGLLRTFNALTALLALRVLAIYFEVFGSLLNTGFGLLSGGLLTLLLAFFWRKKSRGLAERFAPGRGGIDGVA
jgi:uncharacterized membrane protein